MTPLDALLAAGLRASALRLRVLGVFAREPGRYFAVEQVAARLVSCDPRPVSLSTLYRLINSLHQGGVLLACRQSSGLTVFRWQAGELPVMRLVCRRCGRIEEDDDPELYAGLARLLARAGWRRPSLPLDCHGLCADCRRAWRTGRRQVPLPQRDV